MKKLAALLVLSVVTCAGLFALNLGDIKGTWQDAQWDANWTFSADGAIVLSIASTGETVFTFSDSNVSDFKYNVNLKGASISFYCADTHRSYTFFKGLTLKTDLDMTVNPDWTDTDYETSIKFKL